MGKITFSSTYICPVRGLTGFEPPEPARMAESVKSARELGLEKIYLPLLEAAMVSSARRKITYLDGLVRVLDQMEESGSGAWLIAPARRVMGLDWPPPYLIKGSPDPKGPRVFIDGKVRQVKAYNWWKDLSVIEKRVKLFRDILSALNGHPAVKGWVIMDRGLEWPRPELREAEWVYQFYISELRDRDETVTVYAGLGWKELLQPEIALRLSSRMDGLRINGLDVRPKALPIEPGLAGELQLAAYLGSLSGWLFKKQIEVEAGWSIGPENDEDKLVTAGCQLTQSGVAGLAWSNLVDPEPGLRHSPPWNLSSHLYQAGLFHPSLKPKEWVEVLFREMKKTRPLENPYGFIDIDQSEYLEDAGTHFLRLWDHFREFIS